MNLRVDGHEVFAATGGRPFDAERPGVIFIHGAGNDHSVWQMPARYFAWHGRSVLAVDLPGHGRSSGTALETVEDLADWVVRLVDASGLKSVSLAGHSMGALVALHAAANLGDRLVALALLGASLRMPVHPDLLAAARRGDHVAFELILSWGLAPTAQIGGHRAPGLWMTGSGMRLLERIPDGVFATDLKSCDAYLGAEQAAGAVSCPTLLVSGARDRLTPPEGAKELQSLIPGSRMEIIADCGHMMLAEKPNETLDALRSIL